MGPAWWLWKIKKNIGPRLSKPSAWGNFSASPTWNTRPTTGCGARSTALWVHRNLFWQLSRDGNLHGLIMSHAKTASQKPSLRAPWRIGDVVVGRVKSWMNNIKKWTSLPMPDLFTMAFCRKDCKGISAPLSVMFRRRTNWWRDWTELKLCKLCTADHHK